MADVTDSKIEVVPADDTTSSKFEEDFWVLSFTEWVTLILLVFFFFYPMIKAQWSFIKDVRVFLTRGCKRKGTRCCKKR